MYNPNNPERLQRSATFHAKSPIYSQILQSDYESFNSILKTLHAHKQLNELSLGLTCNGRPSVLLYLINYKMQLLVAALCTDKYFWKSEFGLGIFKIKRSC